MSPLILLFVCPVHTGQMPFFGMTKPPAGLLRSGSEPAPAPQAIIVGMVGSPGVQLDLGRAKTALPGVKRDCDVLLVVTRQRAVLLYFAVGEDVRCTHRGRIQRYCTVFVKSFITPPSPSYLSAEMVPWPEVWTIPP